MNPEQARKVLIQQDYFCMESATAPAPTVFTYCNTKKWHSELGAFSYLPYFELLLSETESVTKYSILDSNPSGILIHILHYVQYFQM